MLEFKADVTGSYAFQVVQEGVLHKEISVFTVEAEN